MSKIVIDTSAVLAVLLNESSRNAILSVTSGVELISPASLPFEITNALSARMKRAHGTPEKLTPKEAEQVWSLFGKVDVILYPMDHLAHAQALSIAAQQKIYCYDAYMIALALTQRASLLTLDGAGKKQGLRQVASALGVNLVKWEDNDANL